jgi:hypothetical protein
MKPQANTPTYFFIFVSDEEKCFITLTPGLQPGAGPIYLTFYSHDLQMFIIS